LWGANFETTSSKLRNLATNFDAFLTKRFSETLKNVPLDENDEII
jgi:hypothetical protein